jgi:hypothetical protein
MNGEQYENLALLFMNCERFIDELLVIPFVIIISIVVPFKLVKHWQFREEKAC